MSQDSYRLQKGFQGLNPTQDNPATGYLGTLLDGAYRIPNLRYPAKYYVRFPDNRFISALHKGRVRPLGTFAVSVEVEVFVNERNQWEIKGLAPVQSDAVQQMFGNEIYVAEHHHGIIDMDWIGVKDFTIGNFLLSDGAVFNSVDFSDAVDDVIALANLDDLADVVVPTPTDGDLLTWDLVTAKWINLPAPPPVATLDDLTDVVAPTPADGDVLTWVTADMMWENKPAIGGGGGGGGTALVSDRKSYVGGDFTRSGALADVDASLDITLTTGARRVLIGWILNAGNPNTADALVDVEIDGVLQGEPLGLIFAGGDANNRNLSGSYLTDALSAGSHTFKLMVGTDAGTATFYASHTYGRIDFWVEEQAAMEGGGSSGGSGTGSSLVLDSSETTDIANPIALSALTWTDIGSEQSFTLANSNVPVQVSVFGQILIGTTQDENAVRIVIDAAGTPIIRIISGGFTPTAQYTNTLAGVDSAFFDNLSAGSHTIKVQIFSYEGNNAYCRPLTLPDVEGLNIQVVEHGGGGSGVGSIYPTRATLWHDESIVLVGSALTAIVLTTEKYDTETYQDPPADGDSFTNSFLLKAGTYTFFALGQTDTNRAIVDWYLDDVLAVAGQDWYSGVNTLNVTISASVTVVGDGRHVLRAVINGKNGSSTNFYHTFTKMWFEPATDTIEIVAGGGGGSTGPVLIYDNTLGSDGVWTVTNSDLLAGAFADYMNISGEVTRLRTDNAYGGAGDNIALYVGNGAVDSTNANYRRIRALTTLTGTTVDEADQPLVNVVPDDGASAGFYGNVQFTVFDINSADDKLMTATSQGRLAASQMVQETDTAQWENTAVIDHLKLQVNGSGNFRSGARLRLYGKS